MCEGRVSGSVEDGISAEETEITGDIVFLLPEKFTHKLVMVL